MSSDPMMSGDPMMSSEHVSSAQDLSRDLRAQRILDRAQAAGESVPRAGDEVVDWLNAATSEDPAGRYLTEIWRERTDLWETFPGMLLDPDAAQRFRLWAYHFAAAECNAPAQLIPAAPVGITDLIAPPPTGPPPALTSGVQLYGYLRATLGLGEAARRLVSLLELGNEPTLARPYDHIGSPLAYPWPDPLVVVEDKQRTNTQGAPHSDHNKGVDARTVAQNDIGLSNTDTAAHRSMSPSSPPETATVGNSRPSNNQRSESFNYDIAILCVNGAETARLTRAIGGASLHGRYRIGLWFWELEQLTPEMAVGLEHLDEVWVTSEFVANAVRTAAPPNFPVHILPLGMDLPSANSVPMGQPVPVGQPVPLGQPVPSGHRVPTSTERAATRSRLGMPSDAAQGLAIGFAFDYASRIARKNPLGLIDAFIKAFPKPFSIGANLGPWLVIKAINPGATPNDADRVRSASAGRPDIVLLEQHLSPQDQRAYISSLDVVASLHRSEGYGLLMLEAMNQGIPTVATEYSGNLAFMSHQNSWLIPATRITVDETAEPYPAGYTWADPAIASAASTLRWIISGLTTSSSRATTDVSNRTNQALLDTRPLVDGTTGAAFVRQRLAEIRASRT
jgi:glycosyltransferase involved in cell wall biosynthesis